MNNNQKKIIASLEAEFNRINSKQNDDTPSAFSLDSVLSSIDNATKVRNQIVDENVAVASALKDLIHAQLAEFNKAWGDGKYLTACITRYNKKETRHDVMDQFIHRLEERYNHLDIAVVNTFGWEEDSTHYGGVRSEDSLFGFSCNVMFTMEDTIVSTPSGNKVFKKITGITWGLDWLKPETFGHSSLTALVNDNPRLKEKIQRIIERKEGYNA